LSRQAKTVRTRRFTPRPQLASIRMQGRGLTRSTQTNQCSPASTLFFKPSLQLRQEKLVERPAAAPKPTAAVPETPPPARLELSSALYQGELHSTSIRSDVFYLTRSEEPELHSDTARFIDQVYRPEVFHIGKLSSSCTLWTAIKHKNPLCFLLNPYVFEVSW
jgi:hypothetical protein